MAPLSGHNLNRKTLLFISLLLTVALPTVARPQQDQPLGTVARQLREQKANDARKATKVFTNDNLPEPKFGEPISTSPAPPEPASPPTKTASNPATPPPAEETAAKPHESDADKVKTRDYWQDKFKAARSDVARAKEHQQLGEDELYLLQIQQVRELNSIAKEDLNTKVQAKQSEVDIDKAATEAAQKVLSELNKTFNESGAPADWSQTD
jgi:hypothetical protein